MLIDKNQNSLSQILSKRYHDQQIQTDNKIPHLEDTISTHLLSHHKIQDTFSPSQDYKKIKEAEKYIKDALKDTPSFLALADKLQKENIISKQEKIAADFLAAKSPSLDFESFEATSRTQGINLEMQQAIRNLIQKLQMINYLSGNILA